MIRLKMKSTRYGSSNGVQVEEYKKGKTYEIRESLAEIFLKEEWADKVEPEKLEPKDAE